MLEHVLGLMALEGYFLGSVAHVQRNLPHHMKNANNYTGTSRDVAASHATLDRRIRFEDEGRIRTEVQRFHVSHPRAP